MIANGDDTMGHASYNRSSKLGIKSFFGWLSAEQQGTKSLIIKRAIAVVAVLLFLGLGILVRLITPGTNRPQRLNPTAPVSAGKDWLNTSAPPDSTYPTQQS